MSETNNQETLNLEALRKKDKRAFALLVDQNSDHIYRLALRLTGDSQDAEDVVQETFIKAYKNLDKFEGRSKVSTWLYRIATNEALMMIRKRKDGITHIDEGIETDEGETMPIQIVDWCCLPEKEIMTDETRQMLKRAAMQLSTANRAAFLLRDVEGLSTEDAAAALDISESALKVRLMRARMQLREELSEYFASRMAEDDL
ncbi:MAG: sigma-70 family RNA polymerase sigma factor [Anaerolineaceae bacterium]|nr:sigma-70 family RNA polymerase sigma factor [Anaerolineaceae bacterium]